MQKHRNLLYGIMRPVRVFLSIQKCNPNATLLAHRKREKKTSMRRFGKGCNYFGIVMIHHVFVTGLLITSQFLEVKTFASLQDENLVSLKFLMPVICVLHIPYMLVKLGHTDGHLALLHVDTHSLIVGDHCVGIRIPNASMGLLQSRKCPLGHYFWWKYDSAVKFACAIKPILLLVSEWGWNRAEPLSFSEPSTSLVENRNCCRSILFELLVYCVCRITSNRLTNFIELAPHVLIPMHGRVNLWPKRMLCGYLKNRRSRELSILEAIENGAKTLIDIVANIYSEVDRSLWLPASSNVRLHVEHLAQQNKLPKEFSIQKFQRTCGVHFISRWIWAYLAAEFLSRSKNLHIPKILIGGAVVSFAVFYSLKYKLS
ncbi:hypothetical protein NC651_023426 [Populus alba x Populus x berolinensis]|nr:hypothetical protein NC651_023426 [Populus alba x Populus x berolinensis]